MLKSIKSYNISGADCLPIIEGGKGVGVTTGVTAGHFAKAGAVGTFSGVNADYIDENGNFIPLVYKTHTRRERHEELIIDSIRGGISQAVGVLDKLMFKLLVYVAVPVFPNKPI